MEKKHICIGTEEYIWEELEIIYIKKWSGTFLVVHLRKLRRRRVFGRHCTQLRTIIIKTHFNVSLVVSKGLSHILFSLVNMEINASWLHWNWERQSRGELHPPVAAGVRTDHPAGTRAGPKLQFTKILDPALLQYLSVYFKFSQYQM